MEDMEITEVFLGLSAVFSYLDATPNSRCVTEGEEVLNAKHLILCGIKTVESGTIFNIFALCLQTSALRSNPHEIDGTLIIKDNTADIGAFKCTCKAGLSGKCKHISAVLLKCTRGNVLELETISGTDVKCYWSGEKRKTQDQYLPCPIMETSCVKEKIKVHGRILSDEETAECFNTLLAACTTSAQSKHLNGRREIPSIPQEIVEIPIQLTEIINNANLSPFLSTINMGFLEDIRDCCKDTYNSLFKQIDILGIAMKTEQGTDIWKFERQFRITGSRCYSLFTYRGSDWTKKSETYFYPKPFTSKYVQHGLKYQKEALECYKLSNNYEVYSLGLFVCHLYPWLAYSPDGVVFSNGKPVKLLEIKCPYSGKDEPSISFVHTCNYLSITTEGIKLKKKHAYYAQVMMGMALLNLPECDFVIYSPKSRSFLNIIVPFDEDYASELITKISLNFFKYMIHTICEKNKN